MSLAMGLRPDAGEGMETAAEMQGIGKAYGGGKGGDRFVCFDQQATSATQGQLGQVARR